MPALVLEAADRPAGSWPQYYDSLRLFSPAGFSSMPTTLRGVSADAAAVAAPLAA